MSDHGEGRSRCFILVIRRSHPHTRHHCAGHIALLLRQEGILIAGDICSNIMGLSYSVLNEDRALARESILRVATHPFERANQSLKERFSDD